jgi:hypothetical protein
MTDNEPNVSRERLIELLNEDLAREYQAVIAYVVYSQVIKGAAYMNIAAELEKHAQEELAMPSSSPNKSTILEACQLSPLSRSKPLTRPRTCFAIWTMRTKPFAVIVSGFASVSPWENMQ